MEISMHEENITELAAVEATTLTTTVERLTAATELLEQAVTRMLEHHTGHAEMNLKLAAAEAELSGLRSAPSTVTNGRKTLPVNLLGKHGTTVDSVEGSALDAALTSLSIEQRIAVKAQLMRAGLLG
jgi:hypothetical protein